MTRAQFIRYLKEQLQHYKTQNDFAQYLGVHPAYLSDVLRGKRDPGKGILAPLGFKKVIAYQPRKEGRAAGTHREE